MSGYYGDNSEFYTEDTVPNRMGRGSTLKPFMKGDSVNITNGEKRISESIEDILATPVGSRFFLPEYGSKLYLLLFEQNDFVCKDLAIDYTKDALNKWEPRISLTSITADVEGLVLRITIMYRIKDTGTIGSYVYTIERKLPELW